MCWATKRGTMGGNRPHDTSEQASAKAASGGRSDPDRRRVAVFSARRERRRPIRQLPRPGNSDQDRANRVGVFDRTNQTQTPTAARACQHVDVERAPHQIGPRPVTRDRRRRRLCSRAAHGARVAPAASVARHVARDRRRGSGHGSPELIVGGSSNRGGWS
jgi:hypothetical protein